MRASASLSKPGRQATGRALALSGPVHFGAEGAMQVFWLAAAILLAALGWVPAARSEDKIELSLPLACEPHKTCFIQNYFDDDPGDGVRDYSCGSASYDKHDGIDIRLLSSAAAKAGVPVLASSGGTIKGARDGVTDVLLRNNKKLDDIKGRECGNGVVIDHGNGWETQYCHMKAGSVSVTKGQVVKSGDKLGEVGFSGLADFAHVHLTVRHNGKAVDPFRPEPVEGACQRDPKAASLWQEPVTAAFSYRAGEIMAAGFSAEPLDHDALETDHNATVLPTPNSPAMLFYGRFLNLLAGDRIRVSLTGPGGNLVERLSEPLAKNKAAYLSFSGVKRKEAAWTPGRYEGRTEIVRDGAAVAATTVTLDMPAVTKP